MHLLQRRLTPRPPDPFGSTLGVCNDLTFPHGSVYAWLSVLTGEVEAEHQDGGQQ